MRLQRLDDVPGRKDGIGALLRLRHMHRDAAHAQAKP
jgi:hypothetical protein